MRRFFIIAIMLLGITAAKGQTVLQLNGQTNSGEPVGVDPLTAPASTLSSASSPSPALESGTASGSLTATGSGSGTTGATSSATTSQSPLLLPGEIPDTSTQAASTTATAASPSPICPPPIPSTDGGSANLTEMGGVSLNGC
jgi:hypothetical protein